jgi:hypothetical protein
MTLFACLQVSLRFKPQSSSPFPQPAAHEGARRPNTPVSPEPQRDAPEELSPLSPVPRIGRIPWNYPRNGRCTLGYRTETASPAGSTHVVIAPLIQAETAYDTQLISNYWATRDSVTRSVLANIRQHLEENRHDLMRAYGMRSAF